MELRITLPAGGMVPGEAVAEAIGDALEAVGKTSRGGAGGELRFTVDDRAPKEKVLKAVRLTLELVGAKGARIVLDKDEYPFP